MDLSFYKNKKVLITGHTGFKGSWMCKVLLMAGAQVCGYALPAPTEPSLFNLCGFDKMTETEGLTTVYGDVRDLDKMMKLVNDFQPEIIIHMAAQPIVRESYRDPVSTYSINVMGTVNILECVRQVKSVKSFVNVTTDKVYINREWQWGYRENEELNGYDPYSNSKSCSELVTSSYINSFFSEEQKKGREIAVSTMRAGNVIGGGDFAKDRIIPDMIRAIEKDTVLHVRNPYSTRPYQHVLEPVVAYLMVAAKQYDDNKYMSQYNVGPDDTDAWETGRIVQTFCDKWNQKYNKSNIKASWENKAEENAPHEANYLKLDCTKMKSVFGWKPVWNVETAIDKICEWTSCYMEGKDVSTCMENQIKEYLE